MVATHKPHIFAGGAVLSAAATAVATAAGVAQFREIFDLRIVCALATAAFIAAFFGSILLRKNK